MPGLVLGVASLMMRGFAHPRADRFELILFEFPLLQAAISTGSRAAFTLRDAVAL
jgi:hypothetical protein